MLSSWMGVFITPCIWIPRSLSFPVYDLALVHDGKSNLVMAVAVMSKAVQRIKQHQCSAKQGIHLTQTQTQVYSVTKHLLGIKIN